MASNPTYKPSLFAGRKDPKKLAPLLNSKVAAADNFPALEPRDPGRLPAGLDVQAGDRARRDAGAPARRRSRRSTARRRTSPTTRRSTTGHPTSTSGWTCAPRSPSRATRSSTSSATTSIALPPNRGHPLQGWANRFGFGKHDAASTSAARRRADPDARVAVRSTSAGQPCCGYVDRIWKPGYSIQLAIGQGDLLVTPLQMARFYALIANGGKLVTPHLAEDVEQSGERRPAAARPPPLRRAAAAAGQRRPDRAAVRPARSRGGDARVDRNVVRRVRELPGRHRRQDRLGREVRARAGAIRTRSS